MNEEEILGAPELVRAFHLMWDHFPGPASLIHKSKLVIAVNPACREIGRTVGAYCIKDGPPERHAGCMAAAALANHQAASTRKAHDGTQRIVFWLPIDGHDEYYVHCSIGMKED